MKLQHKYLNPIITFLIVYMFGLLIFGFSTSFVNWIYTYLNHLLPNIFPIYNEIRDPEQTERLEKIFTVLGIFLALFLINWIALKLDNKKYERMIILTDGQYLIKDGIKLYYKEFLVSDIITALLVPMLIVIPPYFMPEELLGYFGLIIPSWLGYSLKYILKLPIAMITAAAFSYVSRVISSLLCVRSWRAAWLSDI